MRLIITEKNNSAKKIAEILSGGAAKADATYKVPFYTRTESDGDQMTVGLKGHVMGIAFPESYSNWQETDLHDLIDAPLVPEPTDKNVVKAVRKLAKEADSVVIATDFDREGELIGLEALREAVDVQPDGGVFALSVGPRVERHLVGGVGLRLAAREDLGDLLRRVVLLRDDQPHSGARVAAAQNGLFGSTTLDRCRLSHTRARNACASTSA